MQLMVKKSLPFINYNMVWYI